MRITLYADFNASNLDVRSGNVAMACAETQRGARFVHASFYIREGIPLSILAAAPL